MPGRGGITDPIPQDFKKIIAEIEGAGVTTYKLSLMMHRQFIQIQRWKKGVEPKYHEGVMLLLIHRVHVPRETETTLQNEPSETHNAETQA